MEWEELMRWNFRESMEKPRIMTDSAHRQTWSAEGYERNARFVSDLGSPVLDLLAPRAGERILDLGCGDGALTERIAMTGASVVGLDSSPEFVAAAQARGLDVHLGDAQKLDLIGGFDAVFSNAALHWMPNYDAVIAGVHRMLVPGGRFVAEFGGHGNVAAIVVAIGAVLHARGLDVRTWSPWYFPTPQEYRERLEAGGFSVETIALHPRPTPLPTGMTGWLETFAAPFFAGLSEADRPVAFAEVVERTRPALCDGRGNWTADYVRLRFAARRT
jgi:trans-aconitate methyltransferase